MIVGLLAAGAVLCVCGLFALSFGLSYKEFSVGGTMIQAGVTLLGSGIVVVALAIVATELRKLTDVLLGKRPAAAAGGRGRQLNIPQGLFPEPPAGEAPAGDEAAPAAPAEAAPAPAEDIVPSAGSAAMPPLRKPFEPEPIPEPRSFDSAWPGPPGSAPAAPPPPGNPMLDPAGNAAPAQDATPPRRSDLFRRSARASSLSGHPPAEPPGKSEPPTPPGPAPAPEVTVLKSGVVDGMAYTLYSDGSIEAELADGKVRFASIDALRAHLDQRDNH